MISNSSFENFPVSTLQRPLGWTIADPPFYTGFEFEKVNVAYWSKYVAQNRNYAYYAGVIYIATIFGLQRYMRGRKAFDLRMPLFIWNLCLGIFSIAAFIRTVPGILAVIFQPNGLYNSVCVKEGLDTPTIFWSILFTVSKFVELGDTVFIVLRKRPLIFLQWYHHIITLWVVWISAPLAEPIIRWYGILNAGVHSLMYPYFALRAVGLSLPSPLVNLITSLQFTQMLVGFCVNTSSWYFYSSGYDCVRYPISIKAFVLVYGSFILLFGRLFYNSVIKKGRMLRKRQD
ncbi:unnamed protein product [Orchesella dallaii]|uniref:Elongation of very long chain fatty acids protein n=1 Tax=Orchesella dallaii TaxID=48710 RepID=A0ABP1RGW0_9HEXA